MKLINLNRSVHFGIGESVCLITDPEKQRIIYGYIISEKEVKYQLSFCEEISVHSWFEIKQWKGNNK
ncbi:MAG: hypothetical protein ACW972_02060 [Promethearchaeota archaeon]|jgi:hypothetical protein